jgi:cation:H+ antiporter
VILSTVLVVLGIGLLYLGAEWLVQGAADLGLRAGVSSIVIGLTVVSVGTSAPEFAVCVLAALRSNSDIVIGNVLGSNLANVGLILGIASFLRPLEIQGRVVIREIPWMLAITLLAFPLLWNLEMGRLEGAILVGALAVYLAFLVPAVRKEGLGVLGPAGEHVKARRAANSPGRARLGPPIRRVIAGSLTLPAGGYAIVVGASSVAEALGLSELLIGLSIVAVGTSLPELATTVVAAFRKEADLAIGNIVGSNIFNLTFVLGGTALIRPIQIPREVLSVEFPATFFLSLLLLPMALTRMNIQRLEGALLVLAYAGVWVWIALVS